MPNDKNKQGSNKTKSRPTPKPKPNNLIGRRKEIFELNNPDKGTK